MGINLNWFKKMNVRKDEEGFEPFKRTFYRVEFEDVDSVSHSFGNQKALCDLFYKNANLIIPSIDDCSEYEIDNSILNEPEAISKACDIIIEKLKVYDEYDLLERVEWIKKISEEGYYICYDLD